MQHLTISRLARAFGLSRTTLLYYDRLGLLPPSGRTAAGYRCYTQRDSQRLERICRFRRAGLTLEEIGSLLARQGPRKRVLEQRLRALGDELLALKSRQRLLVSLIRGGRACPPAVDKATWVDMLRVAGVSPQAMEDWHAEFERRAPEEHHSFLASLGIPPAEIDQIRSWSRQAKRRDPSPDSP